MEVIKQLVAEKFNLFNVNVAKCPVDRSGRPMSNWINKTHQQLVLEHNYNSDLWGLSLGRQENGRHIMSLDFDIYDKNADDGNCEITAAKLAEYLAGMESEDGLYASSTEGNMNVLVDYTDRPDIIEMVKKLGSNKFQHSGLEILLGGNQVIPPSQTKCKRTGALGKPRTFRNDNSFYIIKTDDDYTAKFIIELFNTKFQDLQPKPFARKPIAAATPVSNNTTDEETDEDEDEEFADKYIELLFKVIKNDKDRKGKNMIDWNTWFQIAGILRYNHYEYKILQEYTKLGYNANDYNETTTRELWNNIRNPNKTMSIYGLQNIARRLNPNGYKEWLMKHNEFLHLGILEKGENDIAKFVAPSLIVNLIYCRNEWYEFNAKFWSIVKEPSATITNAIQGKIEEAMSCLLTQITTCVGEEELKALRAKKKLYDDFYKQICKSSFCSQIVKYMKTYLCDNDFCDKLDDGLYKLVYKNGILDLKTNKFTIGISQNDFITKTIPFDYEKATPEHLVEVRTLLKKICNWNDTHLDYYLSALGYAFTGDSQREQFFSYLRGQTASNGKSVIFEVLEHLMPNYVLKANSDVLDKGADMRKEVATWRGLKILWLNEVSVKAKDEDLVKALCDGTGYKYNRLYSTEAVIMAIRFKLFAVSNNSLTIKGDEGVKRRFKLQQFNSQFKDEYDCDYERLEFKKDKDLPMKLKGELKQALIQLIASYSQMYWDEQQLKPYPIEWANEAKDNMADNDKFSEWFYEHYELGIDAYTHKDEFEEQFKISPFKNLKVKDELARMKVPCRYESQTQKSFTTASGATKRKKGYWIGFKPIATTETI